MNSVTFPMLNSYANFFLKKTRWSSLFHAPIAWWWVGMWCVLVNKKAVTIHSCFWAKWQWKKTVPGTKCSDNSMVRTRIVFAILAWSPELKKNIIFPEKTLVCWFLIVHVVKMFIYSPRIPYKERVGQLGP